MLKQKAYRILLTAALLSTSVAAHAELVFFHGDELGLLASGPQFTTEEFETVLGPTTVIDFGDLVISKTGGPGSFMSGANGSAFGGTPESGSGLLAVSVGTPPNSYTYSIVFGNPVRALGLWLIDPHDASGGESTFTLTTDQEQQIFSSGPIGLDTGGMNNEHLFFGATGLDPFTTGVLSLLDVGGTGDNFGIDRLSYAAVPEPSTATPLLLGILFLVLFRRKAT